MGKLLLLVFISCSLALQGQSIKGTVKDAQSGDGLLGAAVLVKGTSFGTSTRDNGNFELKLSASPPVTLVISYVGYTTQEIPVSDFTKKIIIKLVPEEQTVEAVEVVDIRISEKQKQAPLTIESMDQVAIRETPASNFYEGLAHMKGVDLTSASIGFKIINTRGFNSTSPVRSLQLIDGVDNQSPGLNFSLGNFLGSSELDVQKVDLIVGASSAYYGPNAFNGVINMATKDPFLFRGLTAQVKIGERNLAEGAVRWAQVFKNKAGKEKLAYKFNLFYMRALDWYAENYNPTPQSHSALGNPGGWDAVNIYGDEYNRVNDRQGDIRVPGLGIYYRDGYLEKDIVNYNTQNLKINLAVHYKIKDSVILNYAFNFGTGTTVYQGDNRFSLKDILFFQNKIEVKKENKFFFRVYATNEDAGHSYDAFRTALILQNSTGSDLNWGQAYANNWNAYADNRVRSLPGFSSIPPGPGLAARRDSFLMANYYDSLVKYHQVVSDMTNNNANVPLQLSKRYIPGTPQFDSAFHSIISRKVTEGGSLFYDKSALYHAQGQYQFSWKKIDFTTGASSRLYRPNSAGTIFADTNGRKITNFEYGIYAGGERRFLKDKLKANATLRTDKNQNFNRLFSYAASLVYTQKEHVFRVSATSAIRNPTLTDQYFYLDVGRARLLGNLEGYKHLATIESFYTYLSTLNSAQLQYFDVNPVKPESVRTIEFGYRTIINKEIFIDAAYYHSSYHDFLGYKIGIDLELNSSGLPTKSNVYRVTTNSKDVVTTQGFSMTVNYYFKNWMSFTGNYSWNELDRHGSKDPIIPAFNTPLNKFNIGINGREISTKIKKLHLKNWGYSINYRWVEGFTYEGSPQFTGQVPTYDMVDAQVNYNAKKIYTTFKLGANNLLNNKVYQVYGGPRIGRLIYFSGTLELPNWK